MKSLLAQFSSIFSEALVAAFGDAARGLDPMIKASNDAKFGDYQCNVAMSLAKQLGLKPHDVAARIVEALQSTLSRGPAPFVLQVAGPGFINIKIKRDYLEELLRAVPAPPPAASADRLGIDPVLAGHRDTVVVDYSSPNVAKQMHVGHLRSTIIGDTLARVLGFAGHAIVPQNHLGDWGTQFGMIILGIWHLCMAARRGEPAEGLATRLRELADAVQRGGDAKRTSLEAHCRRQQADLDADPDGRLFHEFLSRFTPDLDLLVPAYQYVNAVEAAAEGSDLKVVDPRDGKPVPLSAVSNHVVAMLQRGDEADRQERDAWRLAVRASLTECNEVYRRLGVELNDTHVRGESFFHPMLAAVITEIRTALAAPRGEAIRAVCREDKGALCIFLEKADGSPAFKGPQGDPLPIIAQKSDGAFLYASTDLAAAAFRINDVERHAIRFETRPLPDALTRVTAALPEADPARGRGGLGASRVLYVVGTPQKLHFEMLFAAVRALGWTRPAGAAHEVRLEHVVFGSVLGENRKMLRTRSGDTIKLKDLLDEAETRARALVDENDAKRAEMGLEPLPPDEKQRIAHAVGIGAVKYADLSQNRHSDYVFSWDKMLAMQGNTAPYLMYAHARIRSIHRKGAAGPAAAASIALKEPAEFALGKRILQLPEVLDAVAESLLPHLLCEYLYDLASGFMVFYEQCPVLQAGDEATRASRLALCDLTARTLRAGLHLLGIEAPDRM